MLNLNQIGTIMGRVIWKENQILSIETRDNIYVISQMLKEPYLIFFNLFRENNDWELLNLNQIPTLFCTAVTRQFLKQSKISTLNVQHLTIESFPVHWIKINPDSRQITVWEGTPDEKTFFILGDGGGSLVEKDITQSGFQEEKIIIPSISFSDDEIINNCELTTIGIYPELNERLFLCYQFGYNVNPYKELIFNKNIPIEYKKYIEIISS